MIPIYIYHLLLEDGVLDYKGDARTKAIMDANPSGSMKLGGLSSIDVDNNDDDNIADIIKKHVEQCSTCRNSPDICDRLYNIISKQ